jgi:hypothetical protein
MVVAIAGRRIDAPDSDQVRFPLDNIDAVKEKLRKLFISLHPKALVCSGACGADLLALEVAGKLAIPRSMVLPFEKEIFKTKSVEDRPDNWGNLFDSLCKETDKEEKVQILNYTDSDDVYEKTNIEILKRAVHLSEKFDTIKEITVVIVWEGKPKDKTDATAHFKKEAEKSGFVIKEINTLNK